jgi:nucleotide-binding universal stress UspA family protein
MQGGFMVKKVIIAIDYSESAQKVAETGFALAQSMNAQVTLLHVMEDSTYYSILEHHSHKNIMGTEVKELNRLVEENPKNAMEKFLDKTRLYLGDNNIKTCLKTGEFAETIINYAKENHAYIIVMGSHGNGWMTNIVLGSVTEEVLRLSTVPVFIVPTGIENK